MPIVSPVANRENTRAGLSKRIAVLSGDFFADAFPKADVIVMGNILHDWDEPKKRMLIGKAFDSLPAGGAFIAIENVIDDARRRNAFGMLMSLNMLIEFGADGGFDYTGAQFDGWCRDAGFSRTEVLPLVGPTSAAIAHKSDERPAAPSRPRGHRAIEPSSSDHPIGRPSTSIGMPPRLGGE